jgi:hypothetical protein
LVAHAQEILSLLQRRKPAKLSIVRIVFGVVGRSKHNEVAFLLLYDLGEIVAVVWRHVTRTAMWAVVVAHAGPFIGPPTAAASTFVVVAEPGHQLSRDEGAYCPILESIG